MDDDPPDDREDAEAPDVVDVPITSELDLHTFRPRECADVVDEYLRAAAEAGLTQVRIIHGKGTGTLRRIVHGVLSRHPAVRAYQLAGSADWGSTSVDLHPTLEAHPAGDSPTSASSTDSNDRS